jgi:ParB/RepB/Spo0J family partition protein
MIHQIEPSKIGVDNRLRKNFDRKKMAELVESIRKHGQLQPGVCTIEDGKPNLLIGERRLRACGALGIPFTYTLREDVVDPFTLKEMELTENLEREDLTFQEVCYAREELHRLWSEKHASDPEARGSYSLRDSADALGISKSILAEDVKLATWMREIPEVAEAKNKTEAKKIMQRLTDVVARKETLKNALEKSRQVSKVVKDESLKPREEGNGQPADAMLAEYDRRVLHGSYPAASERFTEGSFDLVFFDPPWGVDFDTVSEDRGSAKSFDDSMDSFFGEFPKWIERIYELMSEHSHLYLVFGIVHHKFVYDELERVGFKTNRIPIIWHKKGAHRTRNPKIWPGRSYEPIAYARKGSKKLVLAGKPDWIETPMPNKKMKLSHPTAKHPDLLIELLERSCSPGDSVLDPMCGSGMFGVACDHLRDRLALDWWMIEKEDEFRTLAIHNLARGYHEVIGEVKGEDEGSGEFKSLIPGSDEWMSYWDDHPEEQDNMSDWMDRLKGEK